MKDLKFVTKDDLSKTFETMLESERASLNKPEFRSVFNTSEITECPRRIVYKSLEPNFSFPYTTPIYIKKKWTDLLSKCKHLQQIDVCNIASDCNYNLWSTVDSFLNVDGTIVVLKVQPVSAKDFTKVQQEGAIKKHVVDLMIQVWMAEKEDGILVYENRESLDEYIALHVKPYRPIIESVKKKALQMLDHKVKGTIPKRPYENKSANECGGCEFQTKCWGIS